MTEFTDYLPQIKKLLEKAGMSASQMQLKTCHQGGNNRTFRLETSTHIFAVKKYFRDQGDKRDRLTSEFSFLNYATHAAPDFVPKPYAQDEENGFGLYEFIDGSHITNGITEREVEQAIQFFCLLNHHKMKTNVWHLPLASEAGFSLQDHFQSVDGRVQALERLMKKSDSIEEIELIAELSSCWQSTHAACIHEAKNQQIDMQMKLVASARCISPSDFGFHNALYEENYARIRFIDFEYAGWDDPARMVNDFFSQLAVPVPSVYYEWFVNEVMRPFENASLLIERAHMLKNVYQIKWCCIALNIFIPTHLARRRFANPQLNEVDLKKTQMNKAKSILNNLEV